MQSDLELLEALLNPHQTHPPTSLTSTSQHQELLEEACSYLTKTRWRQCVGQEGSGDCRHIAPICAPWMFTLRWAHERRVPAILFLSRAWFLGGLTSKKRAGSYSEPTSCRFFHLPQPLLVYFSALCHLYTSLILPPAVMLCTLSLIRLAQELHVCLHVR